MIQFLVEFSLSALFDIDDSSSMAKILVHSLFKLAELNDQLKDLILAKCLGQLKRTFGVEEETGAEKKRLASFIEDSNLNLLTSMADHFMGKSYFDRHLDDSAYNYLAEPKFWLLVQTGLVHANPLTRKRALYLLKRATDFALTNHLDLTCHDASSASVHNAVPLFEARCKIWDDFFLCIELLEETSVRSVTPFDDLE